jgi:uncharacterized membrane protein
MNESQPRDFPVDYRSTVFCFLMGSALSFPCGFAWATTARPFTPPEWIEPFYLTTAIASFLLLPFWSVFALRSLPQLRRIGFTTFAALLLFFVVGLLFPAL